jgi:hypothetical protein
LASSEALPSLGRCGGGGGGGVVDYTDDSQKHVEVLFCLVILKLCPHRIAISYLLSLHAHYYCVAANLFFGLDEIRE